MPKEEAVVVSSQTAGDQTAPRVDMNAVGDFAIVWQGGAVATPGGSSTGSSVLARFFTSEGDAQSSDVVVAESNVETDPKRPDVSIEEKDEVTVAYERRTPADEPQGVEA